MIHSNSQYGHFEGLIKADTDDAARKLQQSVIAAVEPWKTNRERPPFSLAEIFTMAAVAAGADEYPNSWPHLLPNGFEIRHWIKDNFAFWRDRSGELSRGFESYESPVYSPDEIFDSRFDMNSYVEPSEAQIILQHVIGESKPTQFSLLKLSAELRDKIYDLVLSFPPSGVMAVNTISQYEPLTHAFWTRAKASCSAPFDINSWTVGNYEWPYGVDVYASLCVPDNFRGLESSYGFERYHQSCESKLALLLANKEIYAEAMPFFYRANTFMFLSVKHLEHKLRIMPAERRKNLRSVAFSYVPEDISVAVNAFRMLAAIPKLHVIHIDVDEAIWTRTQKLQDPANELLNIAGLDVLADVVCNLQEVKFSSRCPTVASYLQAEMRAAQNTANVVKVDETGEAQGLKADDKTAIGKEAAGVDN